jgi:NADH-quinone oxidoreductase subunit N
MSLDASMFLPILPEIFLFVLALIILALDLILPKEQNHVLGWVTAIGAGLIIILSLPSRPGAQSGLVWGGMLRQDWLAYTFKMLFIFGAGITALFAMDFKDLGERGAFYVLMLVSTIGMCFMASASDLIMLYLGIETTSIPLYVLAGFFIRDDKSTESGFKYLLFGALTSSIMLYGFSLLYGFSGTTSISKIASGLAQGQVPTALVVGSLLLVLVGFGFKISAVPFHFWAPDVYEGAPTPVAGFLSTASKAAGFAVLIRVLLTVFPQITLQWGAVLAALSVATMTLGNLIALTQRNIKRLLAFSSIAHAGYALIGVVAMTPMGITSTVYYLTAYLVTNLAAFGVVTVYGRIAGSDDMTAYYGLSRRSPWLAMAMLVSFLSLAGMPPFGGFVAKVFVFAAAINAGLVWLAFVGIINSIIGLYYYLMVLKYVYLYRAEQAGRPPEDDQKPVPLTRSYQLALVVLTIGIILIGTLLAPWFAWASTAASAMF